MKGIREFKNLRDEDKHFTKLFKEEGSMESALESTGELLIDDGGPLAVVSVVIAGGILVIALIGGAMTTIYETKNGLFKCRKCEETFKVNIGKYMIAPHVFHRRKLKCPHCGEKTWCTFIDTKNPELNDTEFIGE